jgi:hypothetical protein
MHHVTSIAAMSQNTTSDADSFSPSSKLNSGGRKKYQETIPAMNAVATPGPRPPRNVVRMIAGKNVMKGRPAVTCGSIANRRPIEIRSATIAMP